MITEYLKSFVNIQVSVCRTAGSTHRLLQLQPQRKLHEGDFYRADNFLHPQTFQILW